MSTFRVLEELPQKAQDEISRILGVPSAQRTSVEAAYLAARSDYLYNRIIERDADGFIFRCSGLTVPSSGQAGFAVGAIFTDRDLTGSSSVYINQGSTTSCNFVLITGGGGGTGNYADNETPTGTIDGVNAAFTLAHAPNPSSSLQLILNGQYQTQGVEYTLSGLTITFASPPEVELSGLPFKAFYRY